MTDREIIKQLKKLNKIQPSRSWLVLLRRSLSAQADYDLEREGAERFGFVINWLGRAQSLALALSLTLIFIAGPYLTIKASEPSLPGDFLYSIKRAGEDIQRIIVSKESKPQLEVEFASRRLEELTKVSHDFSKTKEVIIDFKDNLASAGQQVREISSKEKAVAVAQKTRQLKENLNKAKEDASDEIKGEIVEAEKAIEQISEDILAVLVADQKDGQEQGIASTTEQIDEEILIFLETVTSTDAEIIEE